MVDKSVLLAGVASLLFAAPALAQGGNSEDPDYQAAVIVTGRGLDATPSTIAYSTIIVDREQLQSAASGRMEDALSNIAGFQQFRRSDSRSSNPTAQGVTLRALGGNASSRALLLLDGVPMIDPFFGHVPFSALSPDRLEVVRVTRGGGSGPFGAGALAGAIEFESLDATSLGLVRGHALVNNRGGTEVAGGLAPQWDGGFADISGRWDRDDGFWTTPEDQRVDASAKAANESWSASGRVVQALGADTQLQLRGLAFEDNRTLRFHGADNWTKGEDVSLRVIGRGEWQYDALAYGQWRNFSNVVISSSSYAKVLDQRDTPASGFGGKLEVRPPVGDGQTLRLGADFRQSEGDLTEDRYFSSGASNGHRYAGGTNSDLGLFAEYDWTIGPVLLTGGLRADRWSIRDGYHLNVKGDGSVLEDSTYGDRSGWDGSWRVGGTMDVARGVRVRAAAYTGLRLPTLNELYRPFVVFPVTTRANDALKNEELLGFEAGVDVTLPEGVQFSVTVFDNEVDNAIANVTLDATTRQRQNLDAIHAQGVELNTYVGRGPVRFSGSLTYTDAEMQGSGVQADLDGFRPPQTPEWSASGTLSWEPKDDWLFSATLRHVGAQFESDDETDRLPPATTLDLYASVAVTPNVSLVLRGENMLDEDIVTRNQSGSIDLGTPLTVWGGLRVNY